MTQLLINCKWEKPWFKLRYIKSYKNSTKILINLRKIKKKKKIHAHCTNLVKNSFHFHLPNSFSTNLLFTKGTNPRRRGEGGEGPVARPALDRASLHLTSEKKRGTKGGGAEVGRGREGVGAKKLARLQYIFIEGAVRRREEGEGERNLNASTAAT